MRALFTIGYQSSDISTVIATLRSHEVECLVDIRQAPISRKPGFSKRALTEALERNGIRYHLVRELGAPKPLRDALRGSADYPAFFRAYRRHLRTQGPKLRALARLDGRFALFCFERDPACCHRSVVAEQLTKLTGLATDHLFASESPGGKPRGF